MNSYRHHMYTGLNSIVKRMEILRLQFPTLVKKYSFLSGVNASEAGVTVNLICVRHGMKELKTGCLRSRNWGIYDVQRLSKVKVYLGGFIDFMLAFNNEAHE
jgi:hypothetical protein